MADSCRTSAQATTTDMERCVCANCTAVTPLSLCSRCRLIFYCGKICQRSHYPEHKKFCTVQEDVLGDSEFRSGMVTYCRNSLDRKVTQLILISRWWYLPQNGDIRPIQYCGMGQINCILKVQHPELEVHNTQVKLTDCGSKLVTYYWNNKAPGAPGALNFHSSQLSGTQFDIDVIAHFD